MAFSGPGNGAFPLNARRGKKLRHTGTATLAGHFRAMGKWIGILIAAIVGLAVLGFLVDAVRVIAWFLLVVCLIVLGVRMIARRNS